MSTGTPSTPPGWYPNPETPGTSRWWDGAQWTDHIHDPKTAEPAPYSLAPIEVDSSLKVSNVFVWVLSFIPLLSLFTILTFDYTGYMHDSMTQGTTGRLAMFSPGYLILQASSFGLYLLSALVAFLDWRVLKRIGLQRPFHFAWVFLSAGVYVIGRAIIARRRSGKGFAPMWVWVAVEVVVAVLVFGRVFSAMASAFSTIAPVG